MIEGSRVVIDLATEEYNKAIELKHGRTWKQILFIGLMDE